jgi:non-heme chloroperoxidase
MIIDTPLPVLLDTLALNVVADLRAELRTITVPTLILQGDRDASAPLQLTGRKTVQLMPDATLKVYPGAGHGLYAADSTSVNADILAFINGSLPAPTGP